MLLDMWLEVDQNDYMSACILKAMVGTEKEHQHRATIARMVATVTLMPGRHLQSISLFFHLSEWIFKQTVNEIVMLYTFKLPYILNAQKKKL